MQTRTGTPRSGAIASQTETEEAFASAGTAIVALIRSVAALEVEKLLSAAKRPTDPQVSAPPKVSRAAKPAVVETEAEVVEDEDDAPAQRVVSMGSARASSGARTASATLKPAASLDPEDNDVEQVQISVESLKTMSRQQLKPIAETLGIVTQGMKADAMRDEILTAAKAKGLLADAKAKGPSLKKAAPNIHPADAEEFESAMEDEEEEEPVVAAKSKPSMARKPAGGKDFKAIAEDAGTDWETRKAAAGKIAGDEFPADSLEEMVAFFDENADHEDVKGNYESMGCDEDCYNCVAYFQSKCFNRFNQ